MIVYDLVKKNRSYRRFDENSPVGPEVLEELVDLARLSASAANLQPLKYILSCEPKKNRLIFSHLGWAAYLKDWPGPAEGQRPSAYIVILGDTSVSKTFGCDHGIAAQSILLGAVERGLGGCMIASIQRSRMRDALNIPARFEILLVVAIGRPMEEVVIEDLEPGGSVEYWRDDRGTHHVPKRGLGDIILPL
ncbi:MAG: nitroreductase A [Deltaproteobacteria bacterium ADurb.BinA179]|jgi:nitroreductase|nr:nitroreductase family protein [Pseudomonadota bacterium]NLW68007.1 nitroreductase family protein [Bacteriovoracaceae bacterium]OPZ30087.1 MAG: nitroreductase A [Deltaproteobacteria bacterium ADurb.BinA179]HNR52229.1 nitroreductase family protein [Deltaproteobacteria bacterium]HRR20033.1 nitroreductase family protein [Desulfomonilia bacterium]